MTTLKDQILQLPEEIFRHGDILIRPIEDDYDLWFATVECTISDEQRNYVNPAGFDIGRAYLHPEDHMPCLICKADGTRIGFLVFRRWEEDCIYYNWAFQLDQHYQGQGYGRATAALAVQILQTAFHGSWIKLSIEPSNEKAQRLYRSLGFALLDEKDGEDLVFGFIR